MKKTEKTNTTILTLYKSRQEDLKGKVSKNVEENVQKVLHACSEAAMMASHDERIIVVINGLKVSINDRGVSELYWTHQDPFLGKELHGFTTELFIEGSFQTALVKALLEEGFRDITNHELDVPDEWDVSRPYTYCIP